MPLSRAVNDAQARVAVCEEELSLHGSKARAQLAHLQESKEKLAKVI